MRTRAALSVLAAALTAVALIGAIAAAHAQEQQKSALVACPQKGAFGPIVDELKNRGRQEMRGRGLSHDGTAMVLFMDGDATAWTMVQAWPQGAACVFDHGKDFELLGAPGTAT